MLPPLPYRRHLHQCLQQFRPQLRQPESPSHNLQNQDGISFFYCRSDRAFNLKYLSGSSCLDLNTSRSRCCRRSCRCRRRCYGASWRCRRCAHCTVFFYGHIINRSIYCNRIAFHSIFLLHIIQTQILFKNLEYLTETPSGILISLESSLRELSIQRTHLKFKYFSRKFAPRTFNPTNPLEVQIFSRKFAPRTFNPTNPLEVQIFSRKFAPRTFNPTNPLVRWI